MEIFDVPYKPGLEFQRTFSAGNAHTQLQRSIELTLHRCGMHSVRPEVLQWWTDTMTTPNVVSPFFSLFF